MHRKSDYTRVISRTGLSLLREQCWVWLSVGKKPVTFFLEHPIKCCGSMWYHGYDVMFTAVRYVQIVTNFLWFYRLVLRWWLRQLRVCKILIPKLIRKRLSICYCSIVGFWIFWSVFKNFNLDTSKRQSRFIKSINL